MKSTLIRSAIQKLLCVTLVGAALPSHAVDATPKRLREIGEKFNVADAALLALSKQTTCTKENYLNAQGFEADIRSAQLNVRGVISDLDREIRAKVAERDALNAKLNVGKDEKPKNFVQVMGGLAMRPDAIDKVSINKLISLINSNVKVSFIDSSGKRRSANNKDLAALEKDREAKAVLINVALSWMANASLLKNFKYGGSVSDSKDRLIKKDASLSDATQVSDANLELLSADSRALIPGSQVSVEAVPHFDVPHGSSKGLAGIGTLLQEEAKQIDVGAIRSVLTEVKTANQASAAKNMPEGEAEKVTQQVKNLDAEIAAIEKTLAPWKQLDSNMEAPVAAAKVRLGKCGVAFKKSAPAAPETAPAPKAAAGTGVLKGIDIHADKEEAPKEDPAPKK